MNTFWKNRSINNFLLKNYDYFVNNVNCKYVWKCNEKNIHKMYKKNITKNHIEIGPGTGYFLKNYNFDNLTLIDVNDDILQNSYDNLSKNAKNLNIINHDLFLKNNKLNNINFESVGINYVLHCVPNTLDDSLKNLIYNLDSHNYKIFGSTIIPPKNKVNIASLELYFLNKYKIFNNLNHNENQLINIKNNNIQLDKIGNNLLFQVDI